VVCAVEVNALQQEMTGYMSVFSKSSSQLLDLSNMTSLNDCVVKIAHSLTIKVIEALTFNRTARELQ